MLHGMHFGAVYCYVGLVSSDNLNTVILKQTESEKFSFTIAKESHNILVKPTGA
jgi:hypothetical protein